VRVTAEVRRRIEAVNRSRSVTRKINFQDWFHDKRAHWLQGKKQKRQELQKQKDEKLARNKDSEVAFKKVVNAIYTINLNNLQNLSILVCVITISWFIAKYLLEYIFKYT
jgi:hypothetical protein